jgi:hypothetical protein
MVLKMHFSGLTVMAVDPMSLGMWCVFITPSSISFSILCSAFHFRLCCSMRLNSFSYMSHFIDRLILSAICNIMDLRMMSVDCVFLFGV